MSVNMRPFDLGKLDFEGNRKKRRKRLLVWTSPIVALLVLGILWFLLPLIATEQAITANKHSDYNTANNWLTILGTNNLLEAYKKPFNQAIIATNQKKFDDASDYFRQSIAQAPEAQKCFIRVQSVLSNELAGDYAVSQKDRQKAITFYTKALSDITTYKDCFKSYEALSLRIALKLSELYNQIKEETYQDKTVTPDSTKTNTDNPSEKQLEDLQKLQQKGEQAKQEYSRKNEYNSDSVSKPW